jgi:hypothetical protein
VLSDGAPVAAAGDLQAGAPEVLMEPYTVRETAKLGEMKADIQREHDAAVTDGRMRRLGVGVHDVQVGPLHFYAGTIFYIPFAAGVALSW